MLTEKTIGFHISAEMGYYQELRMKSYIWRASVVFISWIDSWFLISWNKGNCRSCLWSVHTDLFKGLQEVISSLGNCTNTQWLSQDFPFEQRRLFQWLQSQWLKDHHKHKWELYTYFVTSWSRLSGVLHRGKHDDDGGDGDCRGRPECSTSSADCPRVLMMMLVCSILREWWWWRWRKKWSESWVSDDEE